MVLGAALTGPVLCAYFDNAKKIIDTMKQKQTADVDVASGATYSSKGIIAAVQNALKEAS